MTTGRPAAAARATSEATDAELVRAARERDPRAAALLWDRYATLVRGLLVRSVGPSSEVEDLVQEVFLGLFRNLDDLRDPSALRSFLVGIAVRQAKTALRKRRVRRWLRFGAHDDEGNELPERAGADGRAQLALLRLDRILRGLADQDRLAWVLRHVEGYELPEAAAHLGCSLATVKRRIARAEARIEQAAREDPILRPWVEGTVGLEGADGLGLDQRGGRLDG
jgi:RNA polymerase sigma-70 factor (ECF subfamily)